MTYIDTAKEQDLESVVQLLELFYNEIPGSSDYLSFSRAKVRSDLRLALADHYAVVLVSREEEGGTPTGLLYGRVGGTPFSDELVAAEIAFYLQPEFRRGSTARDLVARFESWARSRRCRLVGLSAFSVNKPVGTFYKRLRYRVGEETYYKVL